MNLVNFTHGFFGIPPLEPAHIKNRIEDAEQDAALEIRHTVEDQRQAANEEMNRGGK